MLNVRGLRLLDSITTIKQSLLLCRELHLRCVHSNYTSRSHSTFVLSVDSISFPLFGVTFLFPCKTPIWNKVQGSQSLLLKPIDTSIVVSAACICLTSNAAT